MIYPKNKLSSAGEQTISRKTFTQNQKDEIRKQIVERLSRKYGLDKIDQINTKVTNYINQNNVTAEGLQQLEKDIGKAQDVQQQSDNRREDEDQKSVVSKMSGASNFDKVDQYTHKSEKNQEEKKSQKMTSLHTKKVENDLGFLNEENQWGAIYKYNKYLYDKEADILKQREEQRKRRIKEELDKQVSEKQHKKVNQQKEEQAFYENQLLQCDMFDKLEHEKQLKAKQLKMIEKKARDQQVKEIKKNRRQEDRQEKALDSYMIQKIKEEIDEEQKFQQFKKEHQYNVMQKLLAENEEKKRQQFEEQEKERQENVRLMDAYCKLLDKQEQERTRALKERDEKIKTYQLKALEQQEKELEKKIGALEKRAEKYENRKERRIQELEKEAELKKQQQKLFTREYLNKQMEEKESQKQREKFRDQEQATLWKEDTQNYFDYEKQREDEKKRIYKEYQKSLLEQMKEKSDVKRSIIDEMAQHEQVLSKQSLTDIDYMK
ncbi:hypothetical protein pb186bvf_015492 [Paramecium bursaria]